jgi:hypothetical protein
MFLSGGDWWLMNWGLLFVLFIEVSSKDSYYFVIETFYGTPVICTGGEMIIVGLP